MNMEICDLNSNYSSTSLKKNIIISPIMKLVNFSLHTNFW